MRWSLDLRWQNPDQPSGAFGLKQLIPMTAAAAEVMKQDGVRADEGVAATASTSDCKFEIPWEGWTAQSRQVAAPAQHGAASSMLATDNQADIDRGLEEPDLCPIIVGPWLDTWEVTHESKHTRAWKAMKQR